MYFKNITPGYTYASSGGKRIRINPGQTVKMTPSDLRLNGSAMSKLAMSDSLGYDESMATIHRTVAAEAPTVVGPAPTPAAPATVVIEVPAKVESEIEIKAEEPEEKELPVEDEKEIVEEIDKVDVLDDVSELAIPEEEVIEEEIIDEDEEK